MANATVTKGSTVEVSIEEPGFHGAWYVATILDEVGAPTKTRSSNKKSKNPNFNKIGYKVKYDTLVQEDNIDEPLTEVVPPSLVRPLPPRNVRRNDGSNAKEAELAAAAAAEEEEGGFEVYDVVDAYHREGWWVGVVKDAIFEGGMKKYAVLFENPREEFEFEKSNLRFHVDWVDSCWLTPSKKKPDEELGFTTPAKETVINDPTVNPPLSAKKNSSRKRSEINSVVVTYSRNKRNVNSVENNSRGKKFKSSGGKGNTKAIVSVLVTSGSDGVHEDSLTQTREAEDGKSHQKRKRGGTSKLAVKKPNGLLEGTEDTTNVDEAPLSVWFKGMHPLSVLKRSSRFSPPDNSPSQAIVVPSGGTTTTTDYQQDWPFVKRAPIWDTIQSLELYQTPPQKPHFSPLKKMKEDYREGLAIAHMVTFGNIVQRLSYLQLSDTIDTINSSLETLCELESHGFNVGSIRARLTELVLLKSKVCPYEDRRKEVENELEKSNNQKCGVEKELCQLEAKMKVLKEKTEQAVAMRKAKEEEIVRLKSNLDLVSNQINEWEIAFENVCKKGLV